MEKTPATAGLADQIASLSDALNQQKTEFRETETALVSRIADVDDDRRLTTNRLQRAWQTHRDEIDARLKQQAKLFTGGLVLLALLLGIALLFAYSQLDNARRALLEETAQLRLDYQRLAALSTPDESVQESMASLRASLTEISASLEERQTSSTPAPAGDTGPVDPEPANAAPAFDAESARPPAESPDPLRDETPEPASQPAIDSSLRAAPETSLEQALLPGAEAATPMTSDKGPDTLSKAEAQPETAPDAIQDEMASEKEVRQPAAQTQTPEPVPEEPLAASLEPAVEATPLRTAEAATPTPAEAPNAPSEADAQPETAPDAIQGETASDDDLLQPAEQAPEPAPDERLAADPDPTLEEAPLRTAEASTTAPEERPDAPSEAEAQPAAASDAASVSDPAPAPARELRTREAGGASMVSDQAPPMPELATTEPPAPATRIALIDTTGLAPKNAVATKRATPQVVIADQPHLVEDRPFALQLIGFYSIDTMLDFARREELPSRVYFREESYQGRQWFVLIHSLHPNKSDASAAMAELPRELAMLDLWIRNLSPETRLGILEIER
jgi:DamX protein